MTDDTNKAAPLTVESLSPEVAALVAEARTGLTWIEYSLSIARDARYTNQAAGLANASTALIEMIAALEAQGREAERMRAKVRALDGDAAPAMSAIRAALDGERRADFDSLMSALRYWQETARGAEQREGEAERRRATDSRIITRTALALGGIDPLPPGCEHGGPEMIPAAVTWLRAQLAEVTRERDAYKRAKQENDERFMNERDEAIERARRAEATVSAALLSRPEEYDLLINTALRGAHRLDGPASTWQGPGPNVHAEERDAIEVVAIRFGAGVAKLATLRDAFQSLIDSFAAVAPALDMFETREQAECDIASARETLAEVSRG